MFLFKQFESGLAEVIVEDALRRDAEAVKQVVDGADHHRRTAHEVLDVLGCLVILQVGLVHHIVDKARGVLDTGGVRGGIRTVESEVELEVRELPLDLGEVLKIEGLDKGARSVEEAHLAAGLQSLEEVHDMAPQRGHTGSTANEYVLLLLGIVLRKKELSERTADPNLVARRYGR